MRTRRRCFIFTPRRLTLTRNSNHHRYSDALLARHAARDARLRDELKDALQGVDLLGPTERLDELLDTLDTWLPKVLLPVLYVLMKISRGLGASLSAASTRPW